MSGSLADISTWQKPSRAGRGHVVNVLNRSAGGWAFGCRVDRFDMSVRSARLAQAAQLFADRFVL